MKKASLAALAIVAILSLAAWAVDVSGTWTMSSPGRDGAMMERDITIVQDGNKIKVTMPGRQGGDPITGEGTIEGNAIEWKIVRQGPQGEMVMTYKGTVEGDTMKGTMSMMDREIEWTAKKK
ncbi:MAG: hypothetical protein A2V57_02085 [Candidatus Aminicenantes bacterium RBG_19FT_COMBO_65_30]|nr:MAG: hypothetical protein A2V57_02085 [Candidatus Aminicenantes bacterium RBG_19FT_COMBO_65_30]